MTETLRSYRDLIVWQKAMDLVVELYSRIEAMPSEEKFGLTSQMKRAAISIPSNIAEGKARGTKKDFRHFLIIAQASGAELETHIELIKRLKFIDPEELKSADRLLEEIMKMLTTLIRNLKNA